MEANRTYSRHKTTKFEESRQHTTKLKPSIEELPILEFKLLPFHVKYAYLDGISSLPIIISSSLTNLMDEKLLKVLREHKGAIR